LDKAEMNQMKGLFCVDIFVTLEIFLTKAVPRYNMPSLIDILYRTDRV